MYIGIAGNIGCGKTTLTEMLAEHYQWEPRYETVVNNPYMDDYYKDLRRWSFAMEVFFLKERFKDVIGFADSENIVIQDRTLHEGVFVFTANNYEQGNMSDRDFANYSDLFDTMMTLVKLPDLMIYIRSTVPNLISQIGKRGRECEQTIRIDYLTGLNERYEEWIKNYKGRLIIVDGDTQKFESDTEAFRKITDQIDAMLYGLFK